MSQDKSFPKHKSVLYAFAIERYERAMGGGFYLEAITLCESMITDRLLSSLARREKRILKASTPLNDLIKMHQRLEYEERSATTGGRREPDIFAALMTWKGERNALLHGFAKCVPGDELNDPAVLVDRAKEAALHGMRLFRLLDNWHAKHTRSQGRPDGFDSAA